MEQKTALLTYLVQSLEICFEFNGTVRKEVMWYIQFSKKTSLFQRKDPEGRLHGVLTSILWTVSENLLFLKQRRREKRSLEQCSGCEDRSSMRTRYRPSYCVMCQMVSMIGYKRPVTIDYIVTGRTWILSRVLNILRLTSLVVSH